MDDYHKDSDRVIGKVLESYQAAIDEIDEEMSKIFKTYMVNGKLTPEEANMYLNTTESKDFIDNLKNTISNIKDKDVKAEMLRQINAPAYRARLTRLQAMKEKLNVECKKLADIQVREIEQGLINTANTAYYKTIFDIQQMTGLGFSFAEIPTKQIKEILKNNWSGKHFSKRIWNNTDMLSSELEHILTKGFMNGASIQRMTKEIADKMQTGEFAATRLIRTETTYVANCAELEAYKETGVEKFQFLATLDLRTSDICQEHDGKIYNLDEAVIGENVPPLHANCRSTTLEVFEDDNLAGLERRARDPVTGKNKTVPADINYSDWYKENVSNSPKARIEEKKSRNRANDKKQYERYKEILGKEAPESFEKFQELKYNNIDEWQETKEFFGYKGNNPESDKKYFLINKKIQQLRDDGVIKIKGTVVKPTAQPIKELNEHTLMRMNQRSITKEDAQSFIDNGIIAFKQRLGTQQAYYSEKGFTAISTDGIVGSTGWLDESAEIMIKEVKKIL